MNCIIRECHGCGYADGGVQPRKDGNRCPVCGEPLAVSFDEAGQHGPDSEPEDEDDDAS